MSVAEFNEIQHDWRRWRVRFRYWRNKHRLDNFHRLAREAAYEARKHDKAAAANVKKRWKVVHKAARAMHRNRERSE